MNIIKKSISAFLGLALVYTVTDQYYLSAKADDATVLVTEYSDLWNGNISIKTGETVKWYVNVPEGTEPKGCGATIKIPGLGFGTDADNKDEKHITLVQGENFIYEFTPEKESDILFTCRMGSSCHHNYIHVTADGTPDSNAKKGGRGTSMAAATTTGSTQTSTTTTTAKNNKSANTADSPKTGDNGSTAAELLLFGSFATAYLFRKRHCE